MFHESYQEFIVFLSLMLHKSNQRRFWPKATKAHNSFDSENEIHGNVGHVRARASSYIIIAFLLYFIKQRLTTDPGSLVVK